MEWLVEWDGDSEMEWLVEWDGEIETVLLCDFANVRIKPSNSPLRDIIAYLFM